MTGNKYFKWLVGRGKPFQLPLILTTGRMLISPIFFLFYLKHQALGISLKMLPCVLLCLFVLAECSDFLDGYFARKFGQVTNLGKILDPMADSVTRITIFLTFTQGIVNLPLIFLFIFIYRDSMISTLRTLCAMKGVLLSARMSGKVKAVMQALSILFILVLMIPYAWGKISLNQLRITAACIVAITAIYALISAGEYIYTNRSYIKKAWR